MALGYKKSTAWVIALVLCVVTVAIVFLVGNKINLKSDSNKILGSQVNNTVTALLGNTAIMVSDDGQIGGFHDNTDVFLVDITSKKVLNSIKLGSSSYHITHDKEKSLIYICNTKSGSPIIEHYNGSNGAFLGTISYDEEEYRSLGFGVFIDNFYSQTSEDKENINDYQYNDISAFR